METRKYKGLIFDFNGVLLWDRDLQEQSWIEFSTTLRSAALSRNELAAFVHGRTNQAVMEYLLGKPVDPTDLQNLIQIKESIYRQLCLDRGDELKLSPGAIGLLNYLSEHEIPYTIATSSEKTNLTFFIEHLHLTRWFNTQLIVYDDLVRPGKPAPDCYLQAAKNIGLEPAACVVVEDSEAGIEAAQAAGIGYIVALGHKTRHPHLKAIQGVDEVIENLGQVQTGKLFLDSW